jgi:hypothetical protein
VAEAHLVIGAAFELADRVLTMQIREDHANGGLLRMFEGDDNPGQRGSRLIVNDPRVRRGWLSRRGCRKSEHHGRGQ